MLDCLTCLLTTSAGITGGFAPPTPNAIHTLTRPKDSANLSVASAIRTTGTRALQDAAPKQLQIDDHSALLEELHSILKEIPTESPAGSEDIYGKDISIAWGSEDLQWMNGGPQGCGTGKSQVAATDEQKAKFERAVAIVNHLVSDA